MTARVRGVTAALAVAGLLASVSSTYVHFHLVTDPTYTSFCDISEAVSCSHLYQSRYGSVAGVPVALGGVLWFGALLLLLWADARAPDPARPNVAAYLMVWSTAGLSVAMYMAYASFFVLRAFCLLCGVVYVAVAGIFLLTGSGPATPLRRVPSAVASDVSRLVRHPLGLLTSVLLVAGTFGAAAWFPASGASQVARLEATDSGGSSSSSSDDGSEFERFWSGQPRVDPALARDLETEDATVLVIKFNDYQCPACADTHLAYDPIFMKYESSHPGQVRLVLRDFPLDPACNDEAPNGPHASACEAAVAGRLAKATGEEESRRMDEWLYANQADMTRESIATALNEIAGITPGTFESRYDQVIEAVQADITIGTALPVEATPTFVINGVILKGGLAPQFFDQAIALELERATATP